MTRLLVDTCIFSYILKGDTRAILYRKHLKDNLSCLSFISVAEVYQWALERNWGERRTTEMKAFMNQFSLIPHDDKLSWEWARVRTLKGRPLPLNDAWVAATALRHDLPLVTHNRRNFENIPGLKLVSESV